MVVFSGDVLFFYEEEFIFIVEQKKWTFIYAYSVQYYHKQA